METVTNKTDDPHEPLRERVREELNTAGNSQASLARRIGISQASLSQWMKKNYRGDMQAMANRIAKFFASKDFGMHTTELIVRPPEFYRTYTSELIWADLRYVHLSASIGLIIGDAGVGKTTTAKEYAKQYPNVWIVEASPATSTVLPLLREIGKTLDLDSAGSTKAKQESFILDKLRDTQGLLIIDQAHYLETAALQQLAALRDKSMDNRYGYGIGICMMGNAQVRQNASRGLAQLWSRIAKRLMLTNAHDEDIKRTAEAWADLLEIDCTKELIGFFRRIALHEGGLRNVAETVKLGAYMAAAQGHCVTVKHLEDAWMSTGLNAKRNKQRDEL